MDEQLLRGIVEQAARAPSIHNTQPWRFVLGPARIELWTDPARGLAVLDPTGRARHLSCGAALLHARVAAAAAGLQAHVRLLPDPAEPEHLADLDLEDPASYVDPEAAAEPDAALAAAIATRRTAREPFGRRPVDAETVARLRAAVEAEGCWLRTVDTVDDSIAVASLLARADELEAADPAYLAELRRWTRDDAPEGVPPSAVPPIAPSQRGTNYRMRDFVAERAGTQPGPPEEPPPVERPLVAVLGTADDDTAAWLAAGQGLGRLLLTAEAAGVAASPMTQPLEVPDTRTRLTATLSLVGHPQMILRLGYGAGEAGGPTTPRRRVEEILRKPSQGDA